MRYNYANEKMSQIRTIKDGWYEEYFYYKGFFCKIHQTCAETRFSVYDKYGIEYFAKPSGPGRSQENLKNWINHNLFKEK
jgi:hypothetical protein